MSEEKRAFGHFLPRDEMTRFGGLSYISDESDDDFEEVPFKPLLTAGQPTPIFTPPTLQLLGPEKTAEYVFTHMLVTEIKKTDATWSQVTFLQPLICAYLVYIGSISPDIV
jgi:hypothetical protein